MIQNEQQSSYSRKILNRRIKTIASIDDYNEKVDQSPNFNNSYIKRLQTINNNFTNKDKEHFAISYSNISKIERIQSQVNDIEKMKETYKNRMNKARQNQKSHNKSIENGSATKSIQKHILKPTSTPIFNKNQQHKQIKIKSNNQANSKNQTVQKYIEIEKMQTLQSANKKKYPNCSQISSKYQQYQVGEDFQGYQKPTDNISNLSHVRFQNQHHLTITPTKINFQDFYVNQNQHFNIRNKNYQNSQQHFSCQQKFKCFTKQISEKMALFIQRLTFLQNQNARLQSLQKKFQFQSNQIEILKEKIEQISDQNNQLKKSNLKTQYEKVEVENMLKDVLFQRQINKMHQNSKQNSHRQGSQRLQDLNQIPRGSIQNLMKKNINSMAIDYEKSNMKENQPHTKSKVQNLLQKLQIKVQRV